MGDLYASAIATTVLQIKEIPPRSAEHDGALCLFLLRDEKGAVLEVEEATLRAMLAQYGVISHVELTGTLRDNHGGVVVRFATHEAALAAKRAGPIAGVCAGVDTLYNERPYDERGWCAGSLPLAPCPVAPSSRRSALHSVRPIRPIRPVGPLARRPVVPSAHRPVGPSARRPVGPSSRRPVVPRCIPSLLPTPRRRVPVAGAALRTG